MNWPDIPWRRSVVQMLLDCEDVAHVISEDIMTSVNLQVESLRLAMRAGRSRNP